MQGYTLAINDLTNFTARNADGLKRWLQQIKCFSNPGRKPLIRDMCLVRCVILSRKNCVLQHRNIGVRRQTVGLLLFIYTTKYRLRRILRKRFRVPPCFLSKAVIVQICETVQTPSVLTDWFCSVWTMWTIRTMIYKHISLPSIPAGRRKFRVGREYRLRRILHKRFYIDVKNSRDGSIR